MDPETLRCWMPLQLTRLQGEDEAQETRREYGVKFISAGMVKRRDGQESNWRIPPSVLQPAVKMFDGVAMQVDHASIATWFYPSLRDTAAVTFGAKWDAALKAISGGARLYSREDQAWLRQFLDELLDDQEVGREAPNVGLSAVLFARHEWVPIGDEAEGQREKIMREITHVESVDFVFGPGAEGRLREVLSLLQQSSYLVNGGISQMDPCEICKQVGDACSCNTDGAQTSAATPQPSPVVAQVALPVRQQPPVAPAATPQPPAAAQALPVQQPPVAFPQPPPQNGQDALLQRIDALETVIGGLNTTMGRLAGSLAGVEDPGVIEGMGIPPRGGIQSMSTGADEFENAVDWLFGVPDARTPGPQLRSSRFIYEALTGDFAWQDVFDRERVMLATANPTTLPGLAVNAMNKVIINLWDTLMVYRWYEQIVAVQPGDGSLHDMQWIQFGGIGNLPVVVDGAPYTELNVADTVEADSFIKHGGYVGITRKMLRNSQIAQIQAVPRALAVAAVRTRSSNISGIFTSNSGVGPDLDQDSVALFHTVSHGNLSTAAYSWNAWKAARVESFKQTELGSGKRQGLWPRYWLGPADLYDQALIDFGYGAGPGGRPAVGNNDVNPFAQDRPGDPRPIPLAVPEFTDSNDWAYIADPNLSPIVQMSYSASPGGGSHPLPELFSVTSELAGLMFSNDTLPIKVRDEYAYGVSGYRGIGKRNV